MKVLYIASGDSKYGASQSMLEVMVSMRRYHGIEPVLLTRKKNRINQLCDELGIENYFFWNRDIMAGSAYSNPFLNILKHTVKYFLYLYGGLTQSKVGNIGLDFSSIDLVHSNLNRNDIGVYIAKKYGIPHIWHVRELGKEDYRVWFYKRNCIAYMNRNADVFIAISNCVKKAWTERGIQPGKIQLVYNGIDFSRFVGKKKRTDHRIRIIMAGHIQLTKGQDQLVRAVGLIEDVYRRQVQVDFYGDAYPDYQKKLDLLVTKYGLEGTVHFCGYCNNIPEKLSEYDIGVVCSRAEGFGRVTVEYMAAGLAVVASDCGANVELVENGRTGLLYRYGEPKDLAEKICFLIENRDACDRMAMDGEINVKKRFTTERNVKEIYDVYRNYAKDDEMRN